MKKHLLVVAVLMTFGLTVQAGNNDNGAVTCNGNGSCATNSTTNNTTHNQGGIGYGGSANAQGGTAISGASSNATGGSVKNSGNSSNSIKNDVKNTNVNANSNKQSQGQNQSTNNANNSKQTVNIGGDTFDAPDIPVSSAYAPTIFPTAPCMGSSSGGAQGMGFGISLGSTWEAQECMIAETARGFDQAGYKEDGLAVRCLGKYAKEAPSCKALAEKTAGISKVSPTEEKVAYSVVTNPLGK